MRTLDGVNHVLRTQIWGKPGAGLDRLHPTRDRVRGLGSEVNSFSVLQPRRFGGRKFSLSQGELVFLCLR
jgi:hypothetical protein